MKERQNLIINTSRGRESWSAIDSIIHYGETYYMMESNRYGDEVPCIVIDSCNNVVQWECYDNLVDWVNDYFNN